MLSNSYTVIRSWPRTCIWKISASS